MDDPNLHIVEHPVVQHFLTLMRDKNCPHAQFRFFLDKISVFLAYAAAEIAALPILPVTVDTERRVDVPGKIVFSEEMVQIAILRAGMPMAVAAHSLFPGAPFGQFGLQRVMAGGEVISVREYLAELPELAGKTCFIYDPMIATGATALYALKRLRTLDADVDQLYYISLISSEQGIANIRKHFPNLPIVTAACDPGLEGGYVVPGLGDTGDRIFGEMATSTIRDS